MKVASSEFQQNVGRYVDEALQAPVSITKHGRPHTVLLSVAFFELLMKHYEATSEQELDADTLKAIAVGRKMHVEAARKRRASG